MTPDERDALTPWLCPDCAVLPHGTCRPVEFWCECPACLPHDEEDTDAV